MNNSLSLKVVAALLLVVLVSGHHKRCPRWKRECENYQTHHCDNGEPWKSCCHPAMVDGNGTSANTNMTQYPSQIYHIQTGAFSSINAYCDMQTAGGGWLTILRRSTNSQDNDFSRFSDEYTEGFGDLSTDFWIGLRTMHLLTRNGDCEMRVDLFNNETKESAHVHYDVFKIGDYPNFKLEIGEFSPSSDDLKDSLSEFNNKTFKAQKDSSDENDECVKGRNGWWYVEGSCVIMGSVLTKPSKDLHWWAKQHGQNIQKKFDRYEMKIRPKSCPVTEQTSL